MTIEQKKEWLYRYQNSQRRQKIILLQIEDARGRATSVQSTPGGVHCTGKQCALVPASSAFVCTKAPFRQLVGEPPKPL